jgi:AcrR family transcriptional regulator
MKSRRYRSPLRDAQAKSTRLAVIAAAARLFAENGYVATPIEAVALAAGVARATVFTSVGGKAALLKAAYDVAIVGDDEPVALPDRPRSRQVIAEPDPHLHVGGYAEIVTQIAGRLAALYDAIRIAAGVDVEAAELWRAILAQRRMGAGNFVRQASGKGKLRDGLDEETAADIVFVLNDPALYRTLVLERGWTVAKFQAWLATTMQEQLLPPRAGHRTPG